jgi:outer membrane protein assembly factor BamC
MVRLGSEETAARVALAAPAPVETARARLIPNQPTATLEVNDDFERAWRRVGLALDRTGFTVEDRNRSDGLYYVLTLCYKIINRQIDTDLINLLKINSNIRTRGHFKNIN